MDDDENEDIIVENADQLDEYMSDEEDNELSEPEVQKRLKEIESEFQVSRE